MADRRENYSRLLNRDIDEHYQILPSIGRVSSKTTASPPHTVSPSPVLKLKPALLPDIQKGKVDVVKVPSTQQANKIRTPNSMKRRTPFNPSVNDLHNTWQNPVLLQVKHRAKRPTPHAIGMPPTPSPPMRKLSPSLKLQSSKQSRLPSLKLTAQEKRKYPLCDSFHETALANSNSSTPDIVGIKFIDHPGNAQEFVEYRSLSAVSSESGDLIIDCGKFESLPGINGCGARGVVDSGCSISEISNDQRKCKKLTKNSSNHRLSSTRSGKRRTNTSSSGRLPQL